MQDNNPSAKHPLVPQVAVKLPVAVLAFALCPYAKPKHNTKQKHVGVMTLPHVVLHISRHNVSLDVSISFKL